MTLLRLSGLLPVLALAACVPSTPRPQPQPVAPPVQVLPPRPPVQQPPAPTPNVAWIDALLSAGGWTYRQGGSAAFGLPGSPTFVIACTGSRIRLERPGASGTMLTVRTSSEARNLPATLAGGGLVAELPASDPLLDAIAFSRGRFAVEAAGTARLVIPAWPEAARVVEECR
ncbi:MAG: hypothetical protein ACK4SZ_05475 [Allosphingosinicella sp.]|uniref:hypothetical protein n=1 Tax=Allosphingosinicella sp. TaxID=2823234 RepID=UPI0039578D13